MVQFESVGEVSRNGAMSAVANTMNENNAKILGISAEMGGKRTVEVNSKLFILDRFDDWEVNQLEGAVGATGVVEDATVKELVCTLVGLDAGAITDFSRTEGSSADVIISSATVPAPVAPATSNLTCASSVAKIEVKYCDEAGNQCMIGVELDNDGAVTAFSPLQVGTPDLEADPTCSYTETETQGLLESWGIDDAEDLQPGDLFLIQQKLQIVKDLISAVHSTGKTQGDVMREATQKFAQG